MTASNVGQASERDQSVLCARKSRRIRESRNQRIRKQLIYGRAAKNTICGIFGKIRKTHTQLRRRGRGQEMARCTRARRRTSERGEASGKHGGRERIFRVGVEGGWEGGRGKRKSRGGDHGTGGGIRASMSPHRLLRRHHEQTKTREINI